MFSFYQSPTTKKASIGSAESNLLSLYLMHLTHKIYTSKSAFCDRYIVQIFLFSLRYIYIYVESNLRDTSIIYISVFVCYFLQAVLVESTKIQTKRSGVLPHLHPTLSPYLTTITQRVINCIMSHPLKQPC